MDSDGDLNLRECAWGKALWMLADLAPGDPRAAHALAILNDVDCQEQLSTLPSVSATERPGGPLIVRDVDVLQPWRARFHCASRGSSRRIFSVQS